MGRWRPLRRRHVPGRPRGRHARVGGAGVRADETRVPQRAGVPLPAVPAGHGAQDVLCGGTKTALRRILCRPYGLLICLLYMTSRMMQVYATLVTP